MAPPCAQRLDHRPIPRRARRSDGLTDTALLRQRIRGLAFTAAAAAPVLRGVGACRRHRSFLNDAPAAAGAAATVRRGESRARRGGPREPSGEYANLGAGLRYSAVYSERCLTTRGTGTVKTASIRALSRASWNARLRSSASRLASLPAIVRRPGEDAEEEGEASEEGEAREGGGPSEARPDETEERSRNAASRSSASVAGCEARMPSAFRKYCSSTCARFALKVSSGGASGSFAGDASARPSASPAPVCSLRAKHTDLGADFGTVQGIQSTA